MRSFRCPRPSSTRVALAALVIAGVAAVPVLAVIESFNPVSAANAQPSAPQSDDYDLSFDLSILDDGGPGGG